MAIATRVLSHQEWKDFEARAWAGAWRAPRRRGVPRRPRRRCVVRRLRSECWGPRAGRAHVRGCAPGPPITVSGSLSSFSHCRSVGPKRTTSAISSPARARRRLWRHPGGHGLGGCPPPRRPPAALNDASSATRMKASSFAASMRALSAVTPQTARSSRFSFRGEGSAARRPPRDEWGRPSPVRRVRTPRHSRRTSPCSGPRVGARCDRRVRRTGS